jgi:hypothetical protein
VNREILDDVERILDRGSFYIEGIMQLYAQLAEVYKKSGDIRKVAVFQDQYIALRDSIFNNQLIANLMKVEGDFVGRENKAKLESQHRILELSNDIINRQHTLNIVVGIVAVLLIALVILLLQNIKVKKRTNLLLEIRVKERTIELQKNHDTLLKALQEKDIQVQRISSEIRSSMATINGLGVLVSHDIGTVSASTYLEKIQETSNNLIKGLNRLQDNNSWI